VVLCSAAGGWGIEAAALLAAPMAFSGFLTFLGLQARGWRNLEKPQTFQLGGKVAGEESADISVKTR